MSNNIIPFPTKKRLRQITEEVSQTDLLADEIVSDVIAFLVEEGYNIDNENNLYEISLFYESCRSMLYKFDNKEHPLQTMANELYKIFEYENEEQLEFDF
jgi:hypothetical protein